MNTLALRLADPMPAQDNHPASTTMGDTTPPPARAALLALHAAAQDLTRHDQGTPNPRTASERTVRVDTAPRGGPRSRRAHRVRHTPLLRPTQPQPRPTSPRPHSGTRLRAPGYPRHHTLLRKVIDYANKEAAT